MYNNKTRRSLTLLVGVTLLTGCLSGGMEQHIRPEDTTWVERGKTNKHEVVEKFGEPNLTMPASSQRGAGEYVKYSPIRHPDEYPGGNLMGQLDPRPRGSLPQVYRQPIDRIPTSTSNASHHPPFWIRYDEQGIVQDFGFGRFPSQ